ncbi:MAG: hypothetical protein MI724_05280 [Spirochaetales bacterium]|nr:hypothetical protein [Spirochaetales bacterium]
MHTPGRATSGRFGRRLRIVAAFMTVWATAPLTAQDRIAEEPLPPDALEPLSWPRSTRIFRSPEPFSLNGYDARQAMAMIRRVGLLVRGRDTASREIIVVDSVEAVRGDTIEDYPPLHRQRWDVLLNGAPIDWDDTYIEYGGRLVNLQLLFTYRNQRPVPPVPFLLD